MNIITLGFSNILIVPLSNIFGRRPIAIFCGVLAILTYVWQALATSHGSFLAARACNGVVAATTETIMVQVIADMSDVTLKRTREFLLTGFLGSFSTSVHLGWVYTSLSTSPGLSSDPLYLETSALATVGVASSG